MALRPLIQSLNILHFIFNIKQNKFRTGESLHANHYFNSVGWQVPWDLAFVKEQLFLHAEVSPGFKPHTQSVLEWQWIWVIYFPVLRNCRQ